MTDTRGSIWLRWPDRDSGPLWLGLHLNQRAGHTELVGTEIWTEPPGRARRSLGPGADPADDLLPWPPVSIRSRDLHLSLDAVREALRAVLRASEGDPLVGEALTGLEDRGPGRPRLYPPEHYARVAGVWNQAERRGSKSPTLDVAKAWGVSRSAASKWVMRARVDGLIQPAGEH